MKDIEFKNTFDKIEFDIAMEMYDKHNSKIASIYDNLGDVYSYKDLEEATALKEHDTLQEYKKALKEKCNAIDKTLELIDYYSTTTWGINSSFYLKRFKDTLGGKE